LQIVGSGVFVKVGAFDKARNALFLYYSKDVVKAEVLHFVQNDREKLMYILVKAETLRYAQSDRKKQRQRLFTSFRTTEMAE